MRKGVKLGTKACRRVLLYCVRIRVGRFRLERRRTCIPTDVREKRGAAIGSANCNRCKIKSDNAGRWNALNNHKYAGQFITSLALARRRREKVSRSRYRIYVRVLRLCVCARARRLKIYVIIVCVCVFFYVYIIVILIYILYTLEYNTRAGMCR